MKVPEGSRGKNGEEVRIIAQSSFDVNQEDGKIERAELVGSSAESRCPLQCHAHLVRLV
jgi:hypothetical protein